VLKYVTKGEKGHREQAEHAAAVELAFRNVHRVALGGALRNIRISEGQGASDDVRAEDLYQDRGVACTLCGVVGDWHWVGVVSAGVVEENGGFGYLSVYPGRPCGSDARAENCENVGISGERERCR
jgi:hypothetical protein